MCATVNEFLHTNIFIHLLRETLFSFLNKLLSKFIKIENVSEDLCSIDVDNRPIQLLKENVFIRSATRQLLEKLVDYREIGTVDRDMFFEFYWAAAKYAILKLPFVDAVLKNSKLSARKTCTVEPIIQKFLNIFKYATAEIKKSEMSRSNANC